MQKISTKFRQNTTTEALNVGGVCKNCVFRPVEKSPAQTPYIAESLCLSAMTVGVHNGAVAEEYAVSSTTLMAVKVCRSQSRSS